MHKFGTVVHELAHAMEVRQPELLAKTTAYIESRCQQDEYEPLNKYRTSSKIRADEYVRKDRFLTEHIYSSKVYFENIGYRLRAESQYS